MRPYRLNRIPVAADLDDVDRRLSELLGNLTDEIGALREQLSQVRRQQLAAQAGNRLLSVPEAVDLLGVSERTVKAMVADGRLESVKLGSRRLIPEQAVRRMMEPAGRRRA